MAAQRQRELSTICQTHAVFLIHNLFKPHLLQRILTKTFLVKWFVNACRMQIQIGHKYKYKDTGFGSWWGAWRKRREWRLSDWLEHWSYVRGPEQRLVDSAPWKKERGWFCEGRGACSCETWNCAPIWQERLWPCASSTSLVLRASVVDVSCVSVLVPLSPESRDLLRAMPYDRCVKSVEIGKEEQDLRKMIIKCWDKWITSWGLQKAQSAAKRSEDFL